MKGTLDWQDKTIVNVFDEGSIWAIPFGRLLLENIPMRPKIKILDIGFGTGLPLIELAHRFGETSTIYGIDPWKEGVARARKKIEIFGLNNITIFEQGAESIPLENNSIDLVTSNLGVNNFENKSVVLKEIARVLKPEGQLCITTNPIGTFEELFLVFEKVMKEMGLKNELINLKKYIEHRGSENNTIEEITEFGFNSTKSVFNKTNMRFADAQAIFDHSLMRIGFLEGWEKLIPNELNEIFFEKVKNKITEIINKKGEFKMTIPMLYLEFEKL